MVELINTERRGGLTRLDQCAKHLSTTRTDCNKACTRRAFEVKGTLVKITVTRPDAAKVHLQLRAGCLGCKPAADGAREGPASTQEDQRTTKPSLPPHVTAVYELHNVDLDNISKVGLIGL